MYIAPSTGAPARRSVRVALAQPQLGLEHPLQPIDVGPPDMTVNRIEEGCVDGVVYPVFDKLQIPSIPREHTSDCGCCGSTHEWMSGNGRHGVTRG